MRESNAGVMTPNRWQCSSTLGSSLRSDTSWALDMSDSITGTRLSVDRHAGRPPRIGTRQRAALIPGRAPRTSQTTSGSNPHPRSCGDDDCPSPPVPEPAGTARPSPPRSNGTTGQLYGSLTARIRCSQEYAARTCQDTFGLGCGSPNVLIAFTSVRSAVLPGSGRRISPSIQKTEDVGHSIASPRHVMTFLSAV